MKNLIERKHPAVKVRYTAEQFTQLKKAFARSSCRTIAGYVRQLSLQQPVEILHRNASFDNFVGEIVLLREEMSAVHHIASWTPDQRARLLVLHAEIQSSIDKIAKLCMP